MNTLLIHQRPKKHVSLTALVDVVFILLFFFMLTSSFSQNKGIDFQSPVASESNTVKQPQLIELHQDGSLSLYEKGSLLKLTDATIAEVIDKHKPTVILPNAQTEVQSIVFAMELLKKIGVQQLSLGKSLVSTATTK